MTSSTVFGLVNSVCLSDKTNRQAKYIHRLIMSNDPRPLDPRFHPNKS